MTWLYLRTRGDLLLMILVHLMANYCGTIGIPFSAEVSAEVALAAMFVAGGGLRTAATRGNALGAAPAVELGVGRHRKGEWRT